MKRSSRSKMKNAFQICVSEETVGEKPGGKAEKSHGNKSGVVTRFVLLRRECSTTRLFP